MIYLPIAINSVIIFILYSLASSTWAFPFALSFGIVFSFLLVLYYYALTRRVVWIIITNATNIALINYWIVNTHAAIFASMHDLGILLFFSLLLTITIIICTTDKKQLYYYFISAQSILALMLYILNFSLFGFFTIYVFAYFLLLYSLEKSARFTYKKAIAIALIYSFSLSLFAINELYLEKPLSFLQYYALKSTWHKIELFIVDSELGHKTRLSTKELFSKIKTAILPLEYDYELVSCSRPSPISAINYDLPKLQVLEARGKGNLAPSRWGNYNKDFHAGLAASASSRFFPSENTSIKPGVKPSSAFIMPFPDESIEDENKINLLESSKVFDSKNDRLSNSRITSPNKSSLTALELVLGVRRPSASSSSLVARQMLEKSQFGLRTYATNLDYISHFTAVECQLLTKEIQEVVDGITIANFEVRTLKEKISIDIIPKAPNHPVGVITVRWNEKQSILIIFTRSEDIPTEQSTYNEIAKIGCAGREEGLILTKRVFDKPLDYNPEKPQLKFKNKQQYIAPTLFLVDHEILNKISEIRNANPNLIEGKIQNEKIIEGIKAAMTEVNLNSQILNSTDNAEDLTKVWELKIKNP